jgi:hypothetical protein
LLESFDLNGVVELIKAGRAQRIVVMAGKYHWWAAAAFRRSRSKLGSTYQTISSFALRIPC